ncbi:MAG TPA: NapC/NirT family cytochrome c [Bryobacteraceae bacterium]|nr:NapC/NirT family cytochrome c [Bryobacteraceae bacterium]
MPRTPAWYLLTRHWLSLTGAALVITSWLSLLFITPHQLRGHADNPYVGIIVFFVLPLVFLLGLLLIPIGVYLSKREIRMGLAEAGFDRKTALRRLALFLGITTGVNLLIGTQLTYRAVAHMETPQFCGATCHTMKPQFTAYQNSAHSRVECVECHVAPGAAGWVQSKMNGMRQLVETVMRTAPRPVPSAITSNRLVPARQTCENCHWPDKFSGTRLRILSKYAEDEANTRTQTVLLMMIGGAGFSGIHGAHLGPGIRIRFGATDSSRQSISWVEYHNDTTGEVRRYAAADPPGDSPQVQPQFEMQCVDCHNRPAHTFDLPERAMDKAMAAGQIPISLPFIKKKGVEVLRTEYATREEAATKIPAALTGFYQQNYPALFAQQPQTVSRAAAGVLAIYNRNVFPDLKVTWGTYPNNLGHTDFPGCFRCHDGAHTAQGGNAIAADCNACHEPLAMDEASPQILKTLGLSERLSTMEAAGEQKNYGK